MKLDHLATSIFRIPTDHPESDGTFEWDSTTVVVVEIAADGDHSGIGWTYASPAAANVIHETLRPAIAELPLEDVRGAWDAMLASVRNIGRGGIAATAISAVDVALWDLNARAHGRPLFQFLGAVRDSVPIYGSGGFTSYSVHELVEQLGGWVADGIPRVKMKIGGGWGADPSHDLARIHAVRTAIGPKPELFVDANGAYTVKRAIRLARELNGVASYFEEPVSSDHLHELALVRRAIDQDVAAGEYGWDPWYFHAMTAAGAVDIMQADVTRCLGVTGFLCAGDIAYAAGVGFSAHCSPTIHCHVA
ncbi:MAG TPA: enolase C-terminal domain-like protein, partial [Candidatus Dormibacteraeota bacterium]|nr:enolase C-terminal domain-like protein [Candidatus Dormibacteraeota bacterium]